LNTHLGSLIIAALVLGAAAPRSLPAQGTPMKVDPSWMKVKPVDSTVELLVAAGLTPANGGMNFNGATAGGLTVTVPVKWHVILHFINDDQNMPHSVEVTKAEVPVPAIPAKPAFTGAESKNATQGVDVGSKQDVRFTAEQAGSYVILCEVPGHGAAGMWIRLAVSPTAAKPEIQVTLVPAP
jgi:sulfocyanin